MRKQDFCLCENKVADQLCSNCTVDQRLCFRYSNSNPSSCYIRNFKLLAFLHVSELVGNPASWLLLVKGKVLKVISKGFDFVNMK